MQRSVMIATGTALLLMLVATTPLAAASPDRCAGDAFNGDDYKSCLGVHYNTNGQMDCIGSYVADPSGQYCNGAKMPNT
jgi:hypothetical protein